MMIEQRGETALEDLLKQISFSSQSGGRSKEKGYNLNKIKEQDKDEFANITPSHCRHQNHILFYSNAFKAPWQTLYSLGSESSHTRDWEYPDPTGLSPVLLDSFEAAEDAVRAQHWEAALENYRYCITACRRSKADRCLLTLLRRDCARLHLDLHFPPKALSLCQKLLTEDSEDVLEIQIQEEAIKMLAEDQDIDNSSHITAHETPRQALTSSRSSSRPPSLELETADPTIVEPHLLEAVQDAMAAQRFEAALNLHLCCIKTSDSIADSNQLSLLRRNCVRLYLLQQDPEEALFLCNQILSADNTDMSAIKLQEEAQKMLTAP